MYKILILYKMLTLPLSEFRANTSAMLDLVERGETIRIMRHGKPVADLVPIQVARMGKLPNWKQPFDPVVLPVGATLSQALLDERDESAS
jgi:prevent-host-death family protein